MAKKIKSNFKNILICLLLITALTACLLGLVYKFTKEPIEISKQNKEKSAIEKVLPGKYDRLEEKKFPLEEVAEQNIFKKEASADSLRVNMAYKGDELVGMAVETFTDKGFGGRVKLMVGFTSAGDIYKVEVLSHSETPGLGSKMTDESFYKQFEGKNPGNFILKVKKDGGDVDAITAATISSRAYCDALDRAYNVITNIIGGQDNE